jgi:hypothetical protein
MVYNRLQLLELIRGYDYGEFDGMEICIACSAF